MKSDSNCDLPTGVKFEKLRVTALLSSSEEMQDGTRVLKFNLQDKGVEAISSLNPTSLETFNKEKFLDLHQSNETSFVFLGLIGPFQAIVEGFENYIDSEIVELIKTSESFKHSGLYLVHIKDEETIFIIYYSKDDEDFREVRKDSKIVHFLRYLCELTNQVIFCLSDQGQELFVKNSLQNLTEPTRMEFIESETSQKPEECKITDLGYISAKIVSSDRIFASNFGFCIISEQKLAPESKTQRTEKVGSVTDFKCYIDKKYVDVDEVCDEYKREFMISYFGETYDQMMNKITDEIVKEKKVLKESSKEILINSIALFFIRKLFPFEYKIISNFYASANTAKTDFLRTDLNLSDENLSDSLDQKHRRKIEEKLREKKDEWFSVKTKLLQEELKKRMKAPKHKTFEKLGWKKLTEYARKTLPDYDELITSLLSITNLNNDSLDWEKTLSEFIAKVRKAVKKSCSSDSKIHSYTKKVMDDRAESLKLQKTLPLVQSNFETYIRQQNQLSAKSKKVPPSESKILEIKLTTKVDPQHTLNDESPVKFEMVFEDYKETQEKELTLSIPFVGEKQLNAMHQNHHSFDVERITFKQVGTILIPADVSVFEAYPMQSLKVMILLNERLNSSIKVVKITEEGIVHEILYFTLRYKVSSSSFESKNKILALFYEEDAHSIHLYKFGQDLSKPIKLNSVKLNVPYGFQGPLRFSFQSSSSYLWFFLQNKLIKLNFKTNKFVQKLTYNNSCRKLICTPDGNGLICIPEAGAPVMIMTGTSHVHPTQIVDELSDVVRLTAAWNQTLILEKREEKIFVRKLVITIGSNTDTEIDMFTDLTEQISCSSEHWIRSIYWMFAKFPCNDLLATEQSMTDIWFFLPTTPVNFCEDVKHELQEINEELDETKKALDFIKIHINDLTTYKNIGGVLAKEKERLTKKQLRNFLVKLITFVPIQIARSQLNEFLIMNGNKPLQSSSISVNSVFDLKAQINFGWYESVFNSWSRDIKIVSSMGKQSTGKSYTLNHLTGSSFNIAGDRCTDGCWMSVKVTDNCLYVILDFEGLGSFEKTDQDDMLLSLLCSAVSNFTIFKSEKRLERDVEKLFENISLGCNQLTGTEDFFKGRFMIAINDIDKNEVFEIRREFRQKVDYFFKGESERNLFSQLFKSGYAIICFPFFKTKQYYQQMEDLLFKLKSAECPVFKDGYSFQNSLKLLMAKLAINDSTPLGRQEIEDRIRFLDSNFKCAVKFGQLSGKKSKTREVSLKKVGSQKDEICIFKKVDIPACGLVELEDLQLIITETVMKDLAQQFQNMLPLTRENIRLWREGLELFASACLAFRFERVRDWIEQNLQQWIKCGIDESEDLVRKQLELCDLRYFNYQQQYRFCDQVCAFCFLKCTQKVNHLDDHECSTNHKCIDPCSYCEETREKDCGLRFGHDGNHNCMTSSHTCSAPCYYKSKNGCSAKCMKAIDHTGLHQCEQIIHLCGKPCFLKNCTGSCAENTDNPHAVHECSKKQCDKRCSMEGCPNICVIDDHFHGTEFSKLPFEGHFCGREHECIHLCGEKGFCHTVVEKFAQKKVFRGQKSTFKYDLEFREIGKTLKCRQKIPPFATTHPEEKHACSAKTHTCTTVCPTCENICHKPVDHHLKSKNALHDCCHGNMVNRYFIANEDDIIVGEHRYAVGESSVAEKCHIFCNNLGRGHIHVVPCQNRTVNNDNCPKEPEKRHQTTTYLPHPNMHKDEMTHEAYWNSIQFEDPCLASAQDEFRECPAFCSSADHDEGSSKSYCLLPLWHKPLTKDSQDTSKSLTLKQGHLFACKHVSEMYHFTIFVGNSSTPSIELMNNVLDFVKKRTELEFDDRISVVTCGLDNTYHVVANHINLIDFKLSMLLDKVGLGVTFENALRAIKKKTDHQIKNPSLFFSCDKMETLWCMQSKMDRSTLKPLDDLDYLGISARYPLNVGIGEIAA